MRMKYCYLIICILTLSNIALFSHWVQHKCINELDEPEFTNHSVEDTNEIEQIADQVISKEVEYVDTNNTFSTDSEPRELVLDELDSIDFEQQADNVATLEIESERKTIAKLQNAALSIEAENIDELDKLLVLMNDFNTKIESQRLTNHILDSVVINHNSSQEVKFRMLTHLNGADVSDRLPELEQLIQNSAEIEPWVAWQAFTLITENSLPEDNDYFLDSIKNSNYYPDYLRSASEKLSSDYDGEPFDLRSPKNFEKLGPLFDDTSEY